MVKIARAVANENDRHDSNHLCSFGDHISPPPPKKNTIVHGVAVRIMRLAFVGATLVPLGTAEWLARVDRGRGTLTIGDFAHLSSACLRCLHPRQRWLTGSERAASLSQWWVVTGFSEAQGVEIGCHCRAIGHEYLQQFSGDWLICVSEAQQPHQKRAFRAFKPRSLRGWVRWDL